MTTDTCSWCGSDCLSTVNKECPLVTRVRGIAAGKLTSTTAALIVHTVFDWLHPRSAPAAPTPAASTGIPAIDDLLAECVSVMQIKGKDYTIGSSDKLANFNRGSDYFGIRPEQVWGVYFWKHATAIFNFIKTGGQSESEPIRGRVVDCIVYLMLFALMLSERREPHG